jgi:hypothetical protein
MGLSHTTYVYKWVYKPNLSWYVGSRTAKNAYVGDGYICSSKTVKPLILKSPSDWEHSILATGTKEEMRQLESEILTLADAASDPRSYNKHNQNGKFVCFGHTEETKKKISLTHPFKGKKRPDQAKALTGKKRKPEHIAKWADKLRGRPFTVEHIESLKISFRKWQYVTPNGTFASSREAAIANNCSKAGLLNKCRGYTARGVFYPPKTGWVMEKMK